MTQTEIAAPPTYPLERGDTQPEDDDMVTVKFRTRSDLLARELTDQDWIGLGKFVAELAADVRAGF